MPNDRDVHFLGFARLVWEQLNYDGLTNIADSQLPVAERDRINREIEQAVQEIIARRAYDLVEHTLLSLDIDSTRALISDVPDLTQWPESPTPPPDARVEQAPSDDQLL